MTMSSSKTVDPIKQHIQASSIEYQKNRIHNTNRLKNTQHNNYTEKEDGLYNISKDICIYTFVFWDSEWQQYTTVKVYSN
jgi:hypothetical protein